MTTTHASPPPPPPPPPSPPQNLELVARVEAIAARKGCTPAQLALAWLLAQAPDVIPIRGTKRVAAVEENMGAAAVVLTPAEVQELSEAVPVGGVKGHR